MGIDGKGVYFAGAGDGFGNGWGCGEGSGIAGSNEEIISAGYGAGAGDGLGNGFGDGSGAGAGGPWHEHMCPGRGAGAGDGDGHGVGVIHGRSVEMEMAESSKLQNDVIRRELVIITVPIVTIAVVANQEL